MGVIVSLSSVVVSPHLSSLHLDSVPKIIRSHLFDCLGLLTGQLLKIILKLVEVV
jgi:hypothetical protein